MEYDKNIYKHNLRELIYSLKFTLPNHQVYGKITQNHCKLGHNAIRILKSTQSKRYEYFITDEFKEKIVNNLKDYDKQVDPYSKTRRAYKKNTALRLVTGIKNPFDYVDYSHISEEAEKRYIKRKAKEREAEYEGLSFLECLDKDDEIYNKNY